MTTKYHDSPCDCGADHRQIIEQRIVRAENGCWVWQLGLSRYGYGFMRHAKKYALAHRFSYFNLVGPIPEGLVLDHLCRNRACVNPEHLEHVTSEENSHRGRKPMAGSEDPRHGSVAGHLAGCRCERCKEAMREYDRKRWPKRRVRHNARRREMYAASTTREELN